MKKKNKIFFANPLFCKTVNKEVTSALNMTDVFDST